MTADSSILDDQLFAVRAFDVSREIWLLGLVAEIGTDEKKNASQKGANQASQDEPPDAASSAAGGDHANDDGEQQPEEDDCDHAAILAFA